MQAEPQTWPNWSLYQAVWRWHFVAGLLVMPFLVMMATTGGLYLFKDELNHLAYRRLIDVAPRASAPAPPSLVIRKTEAALHGTVLQITPPERPDRSVVMIVRAPSGEALTAYADPYDATLLGATPYGGVMQLIRKIHSLQRFGFWASCLIEITAGWAIILVGTGIYMWWPRRRRGGVVTVRGRPRSRVFWRDVHAVTGAFVGLVIVFLAATGMPWSLFWGVKVQTWVGMHGLYAPRAPAYTQREDMMALKAAPAAPQTASPELVAELPWAMQKAAAPHSDMGAMPGMPGMDAAPGMNRAASEPRAKIGVDRALQTFRALGLRGAFGLALPIGPAGAYVANARTGQVDSERTVYLDPYSGKVLGDIRFRDWYPAGQAIEWSTNVHMGREYGALNRSVMLAGCIGVIALAISSVTMWWKRRPKGKLGLPAAPADPRVARGLLGVMIPVGIFYPLVGLSMLVALLAELVIRRGRPTTV